MKRMRGSVLVAGVATIAAAAPAAGQQADSTAPAVRAPRIDWTADRRRFGVGDVITVLVDEYTLASADASSLASRDRNRRYSLDAGYGLRSGTATGLDADGSFSSGTAGESRERGRTTRRDRLTSEVTARVVAIEPNGALRIEGTKRLVIDDHEQEVTISGFVRPQDVTSDNVVDSWRLADAVIAYESNGELDDPGGSILGRILGWLWP